MNGMNALLTLADEGPAAETITPGVLGFIAVAGIGLALYFLMKSMRNRLAAIQVEPDDSRPSSAYAKTADKTDSSQPGPNVAPGPTSAS
ncbi:hypothetical protein [Streptomonospora litoralis]|uniref:Uncharacterized protein n=1 Tax=Streptomonospora litoralis TaxID=2498135 RepID=A0A4P6PWA0_9ACTN|nr:hypothetical protein [Streptomonospora litoralis]QBI52496.1 hypothetical protein EKD16_03425 [Streptomonospora litoralis]